MINALHLIWIVPMAGFVGFMIAAILTVGKDCTNGTAPSLGRCFYIKGVIK